MGSEILLRIKSREWNRRTSWTVMHLCKFSQIEATVPGLITPPALTSPLDVSRTPERECVRQPPSKEEQFPKYEATGSSNSPVLPAVEKRVPPSRRWWIHYSRCNNFQTNKQKFSSIPLALMTMISLILELNPENNMSSSSPAVSKHWGGNRTDVLDTPNNIKRYWTDTVQLNFNSHMHNLHIPPGYPHSDA